MSSSNIASRFIIQIEIERDGEEFHAYCPALKGLHTCGSTEEEALKNAKDAAIAYLQSLIKHGDPIPIGIMAKTRSRRTVKKEELELAHA